MEHVLQYYEFKEKQYEIVYGDWKLLDDFDYLSQKREEPTDEAPGDKVVFLIWWRSKEPQHEEPREAQQSNDSRAAREACNEEMLRMFRTINRNQSRKPLHLPRVLGDPLRCKDNDKQEIYYKSLSKMKTQVVKRLHLNVLLGSEHNLEAMFAQECESILTSRMNEDPKLDRHKRSTIYAFSGKKFKKENGEMFFKSCSSGYILWVTYEGAKRFA